MDSLSQSGYYRGSLPIQREGEGGVWLGGLHERVGTLGSLRYNGLMMLGLNGNLL